MGTLMKGQNRAGKPVLSPYWQVAMKSHWTVFAVVTNRAKSPEPSCGERKGKDSGETTKLNGLDPDKPERLN